MKNVKIIFLKELKRIFTDKRMLLALFLPGLLIFALYSIMGKFLFPKFEQTSVSDITYNIAYTDNFGESDLPIVLKGFDLYLEKQETSNKVNYYVVDYIEDDAEFSNKYSTYCLDHTYDVVIRFSNDFESSVFVPGSSNDITMIYDAGTEKGTNCYSILYSFVNASYTNYTINKGGLINSVVTNESSFQMKKVMSILLPMLSILMLYSTMTSITPEAIAGEKERGTLSLILLTPIKNTEFIIGKVLALTLTAIASGAFSFIGVVGSITNIMPEGFKFSFMQIFLLLFIIISILILFVSFGTFVSNLCKTTKETNSYLGPLTVLIVAITVINGFMNISTSALWSSFVPILNSTVCISNLVFDTSSISIIYLVITILTNLIYSFVFVYIVSKLIKKEKFII